MRKSVKKHNSIIKTGKLSSSIQKQKYDYTQFLQGKIRKQQYQTNLINQDVKQLSQKNHHLHLTIQKMFHSQKQLTQKLKNSYEQSNKLKISNNKLNHQIQRLNSKIQKLMTPQKIQQSKQPLQTKMVFKQFLNNSFPKYKQTIKRILRFFMYIQKHQQKSQQDRLSSYHQFFKSLAQKLMSFIFPKKSQQQKHSSIAQSMINKYKNQHQPQHIKQIKLQLINLKNNQSQYINQIQSLQSEVLRLKANKNMLQAKIFTYQKAMKAKAAEFVVHLKKALINKSQYGEEDQAIQKMNEIIQILQTVINYDQNKNIKSINVKDIDVSNKQFYQKFNIKNNIKQLLKQTNKKPQNSNKISKKSQAPPLLKKNIYGYYQQPQFHQQYNNLTLIKHPNLNKQTQTLPDDLTILISKPILLLYLIDGNIKPQRNRHNTQFYIKIHKNSQQQLNSHVVKSFQPVWKRQFLLKNYDYPFIIVQLMNKSKGIKDKTIGNGKLLIQRTQQKIVNIKNGTQFQGRVRFGITYPKGNIFQFVINSIQLIVPQRAQFLSQIIQLSIPMNDIIIQKFQIKQLIKYVVNKSFIIIQGYTQGQLIGSIPNRKLSGSVLLNQFTQKQGSKQIVINMQQNWQIVLEGYIVLIVSEQSQPQRIQYQKQNKYFAVRAGYPLISCKYNNIILYSHVKLPLVYKYYQNSTCLLLITQNKLNKKKTQQTIIQPLLISQNKLKANQYLSAPKHIYQFFLQTLQGPQVKFSYQSCLYVLLPQKIKLQINLTSIINCSQQTPHDLMLKKGKRKQIQQQQQKNRIQFFIQTKDLMQNYYKIINKTYKVTGYTKFKMGYVKILNLLYSQSKQNKIIKELKIKQSIINQPLNGEYYVQFEISKGFFNILNGSNKYSVQLVNKENNNNNKEIYKTEQISVNNNVIEWKQIFLIKCKFNNNKQNPFYITLKLYQHSLLSSQKLIYSIDIPITNNLLKLGKLILNISPQQLQKQKQSQYPLQNYLILDNIKIPSNIYLTHVSAIQMQVDEKADWFGKIDPYIKIFVNNKQIYQSQVVQESGDYTIWNNINKEFVVHQQDQETNKNNNNNNNNTNNNKQLFTCKLYDQDLINDDYLGLSQIKFDKQISQNNTISIIRTNIIKDQKICGSMKIHGKFKLIKQQYNHNSINSNNKIRKLNDKENKVYQVSITEIVLNNQNEIKQESEQITVRLNNNNNGKCIQKQLKLSQSYLNNPNISTFILTTPSTIQQSQLIISFSSYKKQFFSLKKNIITLGQSIINHSNFFNINILSKIPYPIFNKQNKQIGYIILIIQPIYHIFYSMIDTYSTGTNINMISKSENDFVNMKKTKKNQLEMIMDGYQGMYIMGKDWKNIRFSKQVNYNHNNHNNNHVNSNNKSIKNLSISISTQENSTIQQLLFKDPSNSNFVQYLSIFNCLPYNIYSRQLSFTDIDLNISKSVHKIYRLKILHYEPIKFIPQQQFQINLLFNNSKYNNSKLSINTKLNKQFNSYYSFDSNDQHQNTMKIKLFSEYMLPDKINIKNKSNKKQSIQYYQYQQQSQINLFNQQSNKIQTQKYIYLQDKGAFYYQLQQYHEKYRKILFQKLLIKLLSSQIINNQQNQNNYKLKISITQSQIVYYNTKNIGKYGYYFELAEFFVPIKYTDNQFVLKIQVIKINVNNDNNDNNNHLQQIIQSYQVKLKGKNNKYDYIYLLQQDKYMIHSVVIIQSDLSICLPKQVKVPPTLITFIQLQQINLNLSHKYSSQQLKLQIFLFNQVIQLTAIKPSSSQSYLYSLTNKQLLYLYQNKQSIFKINIIRQGLLNNKQIGSCCIKLQKQEQKIEENTINQQIKDQNNIIIGKVQLKYKAIEKINYLYVDINRFVMKYKYEELNVELLPFGHNKNKIQKVTMKFIKNNNNNNNNQKNINNNKNNKKNNNDQQINNNYNHYNTDQDLIIGQNDYQDYKIRISNQDSQNILGQFKLCDLIKKQDNNQYQYISAIHPIRTKKNDLNGLICINYIQYISKNELISLSNNINNNIINLPQCLCLSLINFKFHRQLSDPSIKILYQTTSRKLYSQTLSILNNDSLSGYQLIIQQNQKFNLIIIKDEKQIAYTFVDVNKLKQKNQQIIKFYKYQNNQVYAVCVITIGRINNQNMGKNNDKKYQFLYQIQDLQANKLQDMESFVDMKPYIIIQHHNLQAQPSQQQKKQQKYISRKYYSQYTQGKSNLYWKINMIFNYNIKITLMDKDIKFDDHIGQLLIQCNKIKLQLQNSHKITKKIKLFSNQSNKQTGQVIINIKKRLIQQQRQQENQQSFSINYINKNKLSQQQNNYIYFLHLDDFVFNHNNKELQKIFDMKENYNIQQIKMYMMNQFEEVGNVLYQLYFLNNNNINEINKIFTNGGILIDKAIFKDYNENHNNVKVRIDLKINRNKLQSQKQNKNNYLILTQLINITYTKNNLSDYIIRLPSNKSHNNSNNNQTTLFKYNNNQTILFKQISLIPISICQSISQSDSSLLFTLKTIYLWFDSMYFQKQVQILLLVSNPLISSNQFKSYKLLIDLQRLQYKKGIHLIQIEIRKYLMHDILIRSSDILQFTVYNKYEKISMINNSVINFNLSQQVKLSNKFISQAYLTRDNYNIGKTYIELDKISYQSQNITINNSIQTHQSFLKHIQSHNLPFKSQYLWLQLKILKAQFIKDIQIFSKMDPYCIISTQQSQEYKTLTQNNKGKYPEWNQTFFVFMKNIKRNKNDDNNNDNKIIKLILKDEQTLKDKFIANGQLKFFQFPQLSQLSPDKLQNDKIQLFDQSNKSSGKLFINYKFTKTFIIFTSICYLIPIINKQQPCILTTNEDTKKYQKNIRTIQLFKPYPISQNIPISIMIDNNNNNNNNNKNNVVKIKLSDILKMKQQPMRIYFQKQKVLINYLIFN